MSLANSLTLDDKLTDKSLIYGLINNGPNIDSRRTRALTLFN